MRADGTRTPEATQAMAYDPNVSLLKLISTEKGWLRLRSRFEMNPHPIYPMPTREGMMDRLASGHYTDAEALRRLGVRQQTILQEKLDPLRFGHVPRMWKDAKDWWENGRELLILGGNRCLGGETLIYDPVLNLSRRIEDIGGESHVLSFDGSKVVIGKSGKPFTKGIGQLYRIDLSNGEWFVAAGEHRVFCEDHTWREVRELRQGFALFHPPSTSGICQSTHGEDDQHLLRTERGFQSCCRHDSGLCDGPLLLQAGACQDTFPSQDGVPTHRPVGDSTIHLTWPSYSRSARRNLDGLDSRFECNRFGESFFRHSIQDVQGQISAPYAGILSSIACTPSSPVWMRSEIQGACSSEWQTSPGYFRPESNSLILSLTTGFDECADVAYVTKITKERIGVKWDVTVPAYGNYLCAGVVHHNSSKTFFASRACVDRLVQKPGSMIWCFSTSFETSVRDQQRGIWNFLPPQWRTAKRNRSTNMNYTVKRGFTDKSFIAPNGSECRFMNYLQDGNVIEGGQVDLWWADELIPADWIVTMRSRTVDRRGKGLITQTPIKGYTQTVAEYLNGARVIEWGDCEMLPTQAHWPGGKPGKVPVKMQCMNPSNRVYFFHSKNNIFVPYDELVSAWRDKGSANILCRLYGVTSGISNCKFPRFGSHNVLTHDQISENGTSYHFIDFSWKKPWAMLWVRVFRVADQKIHHIYREWPDCDTYGEWAVRSDKADGFAGPAQHVTGYGIGDYKRIITELEAGVCESGGVGKEVVPDGVFARYGDPRSGASPGLTYEGSTTIFQLLEDETGGQPSIIVEPVEAAGKDRHVLEGVNLINTLLEYNEDKPTGPMNSPSLFISERCKNTIDCLKMWTGKDGPTGASKDFVDLVRYMAIVDPEDMKSMSTELASTGGSY